MLLNVLRVSVPLLLVSLGALVSEYAGVTAIFLEGAVNFSAFLFLLFLTYTKAVLPASLLSICFTCIPVFLLALFSQKRRADIFLLGLAFNLFSGGIISILSSFFFGTNGVVECPPVFSSSAFFQNGSSLLIWFLAIVLVIFFEITPLGFKIRFTGTDPEALSLNGINVSNLRIVSWVAAACLSSAAGMIMVTRLQAFVPGISSGKGWLALVAVFLGRKKVAGVVVAVLLFSALELAGISLQGRLGIPPTVLLSMPYIVVLIIFAFVPER